MQPLVQGLFLVVSTTLSIIGTSLLLSSCYKVEGTPDGVCMDKITVLIEEKWTMWFFVSIFVVMASISYYCMRGAGVCCDGMCNNNRHAILLSVLCAIALTVYSSYVVDRADAFDTTDITDELQCWICPDSSDNTYQMIVWLGVMFIWVGVVVGLLAMCHHHGCIGGCDCVQG